MGLHLTLQSGCMFSAPSSLSLSPLRPGEERTISVDLQAPSVPGMYQAQWRVSTSNGGLCGGVQLCVCVCVGVCRCGCGVAVCL